MENTTQTSTDQQKQPTEQEIAQTLANFDITDKNNALLVLVNAAKLAQSKGAFSLEEAELVSRAIKTFAMPVTPAEPVATTSV